MGPARCLRRGTLRLLSCGRAVRDALELRDEVERLPDSEQPEEAPGLVHQRRVSRRGGPGSFAHLPSPNASVKALLRFAVTVGTSLLTMLRQLLVWQRNWVQLTMLRQLLVVRLL